MEPTDVIVEVSRGIFTKSSSATYVLRVRCADLGLLPELLATLPKLKNVELLGVKWGYDRLAEAHK